MRLHAIHLKNFRQHTDSVIAFAPGLTGIIGANGTGKSTVLEAIAWALYGNAAARGKRDSIKSLRAPARATVRVDLDFSLGGHRYRVVRGVTTAELYVDGATAPAANSSSGVTEVLRRRLGMSREEFFNTYFTGQKELSVMAAMGPTERGQFLSRILGYDRLRIAQELARERRRAIVAETTGLTMGMPDEDTIRRSATDAIEQLASAEAIAIAGRSRYATATEAVLALTPRWDLAQTDRETLRRLASEHDLAESDRGARQRDLDRVEREITGLESARAELATITAAIEPQAGLRADLDAMRRLASEDGRRQALEESDRTMVAELARLSERRAQLAVAPLLESDAVADHARLLAEREELSLAIDAGKMEWVKAKQQAETSAAQVAQSLAKYAKQREMLASEGPDGTCPTCTRALGEHYAGVLASVDEQLASLRAEQTRLVETTNQLKATPAGLAALTLKRSDVSESLTKVETRLGKIRLGLQELAIIETTIADRTSKQQTLLATIAAIPPGYSVDRHASLQVEYAALLALETRAATLSGTLAREAQWRRDRGAATEALAAAHAHLIELATRMAAMTEVESRYAAVRTDIEAATARQRAIEIELATAQVQLRNAAAAADTAARALAAFDQTAARLAALTEERRRHEDLDRAYADLRTELTTQLRPDISERASVLLAELTDGRYTELELDESYEILVIEDSMPKTVISGGEEDLANLVLRLAISQMIAERAGQPLSLLILDEVFGSLDESRRDNVVALLRRLNDRFEQIIIITHIASLRDGLDHTLTIAYDEKSGVARIESEERPDREEADLSALAEPQHQLAGVN